MLVEYKEFANLAGVYKIVNTTSGRIYIGSTSRFKERYKSHNCDLNGNRHKNTFLQNDFNKCGSDNFIFEVIEVVGNKEERLLREQFYIDQYYDKQEQCYNLSKNAFDFRGGTHNKQPLNPETDKRCRPQSEERKIKKKAALDAFWDSEEGQKLKEYRSVFNKLSWDNPKDEKRRAKQEHLKSLTFKHESGEVVTGISNLREWCLSRNLSYKAFHLLVRGSIKTSHGWTI